MGHVTHIRVAASVALAAYGTIGSVLAAPTQAIGSISEIDKGKHQLTLSDGQTYAVPDNIKSDYLKKGDTVSLSFEKVDGANVVQSLSTNRPRP